MYLFASSIFFFRSEKVNCPFLMRVKYSKRKKEKTQTGNEYIEFLKISQLHLLHNHPPDVSIASQ